MILYRDFGEWWTMVLVNDRFPWWLRIVWWWRDWWMISMKATKHHCESKILLHDHFLYADVWGWLELLPQNQIGWWWGHVGYEKHWISQVEIHTFANFRLAQGGNSCQIPQFEDLLIGNQGRYAARLSTIMPYFWGSQPRNLQKKKSILCCPTARV